MSINFFEAKCQDYSNRKLFGLRDDILGQRARIDENNGATWIAVVVNEYLYNVTFTAVDNCIETRRRNGKMDKRCEGFLTFGSSIIFVELKKRGSLGNDWVLESEKQLKTTIDYFKASNDLEDYEDKDAYISNSEHPKIKESQRRRMEQFLSDTGFVLHIMNRIILI